MLQVVNSSSAAHPAERPAVKAPHAAHRAAQPAAQPTKHPAAQRALSSLSTRLLSPSLGQSESPDALGNWSSWSWSRWLLLRKPAISDFYGRHRGETIYVIASGKSLDFVAPDFFSGTITVGVNQVYKRVPGLTYLVRKDSVSAEYLMTLINSPNTSRIVHFVSRGTFGFANWINAEVVQRNFPSHPQVVLFDHEVNTETLNGLPKIRPLHNKLVVSRSTITSATHLAAYLGAKRIILVGHDVGTLDGEVSFRGYHTAESLASFKRGPAGYRRWLLATSRILNSQQETDGTPRVEVDTLRLRSVLQAAYPGLHIHSLNPFVNFGLEGHLYERGVQSPVPVARHTH